MAKLDTAANICMVVLCLAITSDIAYRHLAGRTRAPRDASAGAGEYRVGDRIAAVDGLKYEAASRTVLLVVKSTCGFCRQSVPFYKRLSAAKRPAGQWQLVAACPEDLGTCAGFFKNGGVALDRVLSVPLDALHVRGTPTLLLLNASGTIERVWTGRLTEQGERDVLKTLVGP